MARSDRLLALVQILRRHRRPVTAEVLAGELEVSVRTIYRDVSTLAARQVPVRGEAGMGYVLDSGFDLPPMMFTPDEIEAILVGMRFVKGRGDSALSKAADDVVAKIGAVIPAPSRPMLFEGGLYTPSFGNTIAEEAIDIAPLRHAIRHGNKATIDYEAADGKHSRRTVWPFGLAYFDTVRVFMAWCEMRQDFRHFRTDRLRKLEIGSKYPMRRAVLMRKWEEEEPLHASQTNQIPPPV